MQSVIHHNFQSFAIEWLYLLFLLLLDNRAIFSLHISPQLIAICHSSISSARKAIGCDSPVGMLKCKTTLGDELVMNISRMCTTGTRKKNYLGIHTLKIIYGSTEKTKTCVLKKQNEKRIAKHEMPKKDFFFVLFSLHFLIVDPFGECVSWDLSEGLDGSARDLRRVDHSRLTIIIINDLRSEAISNKPIIANPSV